MDGDKLTIGPNLVSTRMACRPGRGHAVERVFLERLPKVASYSITGSTLTLADSSGEALLVFDASVGADGHRRQLERPQLLHRDRHLLGRVRLDRDGQSSRTARSPEVPAATTTRGPYTIDGDSITIGPLASTRKACSSDEAEQKQEASYLAALEVAKTFAVTGNRLDLFREGGTFAATMEKA